ncbi:GH92 family glycosyl hydrolase [Amycolatopsis sp. cmx-4-83]|uniref:GH92 family glycosyl hydrolase n=1 Tax=Amycolatopsis sp. cmx-4-83 TaxID=2790940 RepID=UPI00397E8CEB
MRRPVTVALAAALFASALTTMSTAADLSPADFVDSLIGSAGDGNTFPGATAPFGMLSWSPTSTRGDQTSTGAANGYQYDTTRVRGFALTHVNGAGCNPGAAGDVPILPFAGDVTSSPTADTTDAVYASNFSHADEGATPGRYRLGLSSGVTTDVAATERTAVGTLDYPEGKPASLLFRTSNSLNGSEDAETHLDPANRKVTGSVLTGAFCGRRANGGVNNRKSYYRLFFTAQFDQPFAGTGTWKDATLQPGGLDQTGGEGYATGKDRAGRGSGGYVTFAPGSKVTMRIAISYVSLDGAERNLRAEQPPNSTVDSVAGRYFGMDRQVHRVEPGQDAQYSNFSGWDQYRAQVQLLALLEPRVAGNFAQLLYNYAEQNDGVWDRWVHVNGATHVMTGDPSAATIATFYAMGVRNFDYRGAFDSLYEQATVPRSEGLQDGGCPGQCVGQRPNLAQYLASHFAPNDVCHCWGGAAETLEDAVADSAIGHFAEQLGRTSEAAELRARGAYWRNVFNPDTGYAQARNLDGSWVTPFDPASDRGFAQGSAAAYTWMVPQDVSGLADAMGGKTAAVTRLDGFFHDANGNWQLKGGGPLKYDPTNEPDIHAPWLYNELGQPAKTQETVRQLVNSVYTTGPAGLPGNDDLGTMSAWYVFAALGIYPRTPGTGELLLSSPLFANAVVRPAGGASIRIATSGSGKYIADVRRGGRPQRDWKLDESFLRTGGTLEFRLSETPTAWGR